MKASLEARNVNESFEYCPRKHKETIGESPKESCRINHVNAISIKLLFRVITVG